MPGLGPGIHVVRGPDLAVPGREGRHHGNPLQLIRQPSSEGGRNMSRKIRKAPSSVDRRGFLGVAAGGVGALALARHGLADSLVPPGTSAGGSIAQARRASVVPTYIAARVAPPDIPGLPNGAEPGYFKFPKDL